MIFSAFGKILVLANVFCSIQIRSKKILKNWFFSFWQDLGFGECFFYWNSNGKILKNWFFQLSARSFFYWNSNYWGLENWFCSFWQDLGFGECFFLFKFLFEKYWKIDFFSFWQDLGFGELFLSIKNLIKKVLKICFLQLFARYWFWRMLFLFKLEF